MASRIGRPPTRILETYVCLTCKQEFQRYPRKGREQKYCSNVCAYKRPWLREHWIAIAPSRRGLPTPWCKGNGGWMKGRKATPRQLEGLKIGWYLSGPDSPAWKGGITPKNVAFRRSRGYQLWRKAVLERDGCCVECGSTSDLQADHIKPWFRFPELGLDVDNGRALCKSCHMLTDTYAGRANRYPAKEVI